MGVEQFQRLLHRRRRVGIDSCIFIYHIEENEKYVALTESIFSWLVQAGNAAVTSTLTMTELLVPPYREGNQTKLNSYSGLLATFPNLDWIAVTVEIADLAAQLRAEYRLRTPDAIQAATALWAKAPILLTNDPAFSRVNGIETILLDEIL